MVDLPAAYGAIVPVDPHDKRGKLVTYTPKGLAALSDGDRIKLDIERRYRERLGEGSFEALMAALRGVAESAAK